MTFNLEAFDPDEALPQNARLDDPEDLIGHKVVAVVEDCAGRLARGGELLIVTETGCRIVLAPKGDVDEMLMLRAGLITQAQRDYLRAEEKKREDAQKAKRAAALREELARLEGS